MSELQDTSRRGGWLDLGRSWGAVRRASMPCSFCTTCRPETALVQQARSRLNSGMDSAVSVVLCSCGVVLQIHVATRSNDLRRRVLLPSSRTWWNTFRNRAGLDADLGKRRVALVLRELPDGARMSSGEGVVPHLVLAGKLGWDGRARSDPTSDGAQRGRVSQLGDLRGRRVHTVSAYQHATQGAKLHDSMSQRKRRKKQCRSAVGSQLVLTLIQITQTDCLLRLVCRPLYEMCNER